MTTTKQQTGKGGPLFCSALFAATRGALGTFNESELRNALARHLSGDWGEVPDEDRQLNNQALADGSRILSAYTIGGEKLWILTDAECLGIRVATTFMLPEEY